MDSDRNVYELLKQLGQELAFNCGKVERWAIEAGPGNYTAFMRALIASKPRVADILATAEEIEFRFKKGDPIAPVTVRLVSAGEPH